MYSDGSKISQNGQGTPISLEENASLLFWPIFLYENEKNWTDRVRDVYLTVPIDMPMACTQYSGRSRISLTRATQTDYVTNPADHVTHFSRKLHENENEMDSSKDKNRISRVVC